MTCERFTELLPEYCERRLNTRDTAFAREHLEICANCRSDFAMWQKLASLPQQEPSPASRARFEHMLSAYEEGRWEKSGLARERAGWLTAWWRSAFAPPLASALAACLLVAGIGFIVHRPLARVPENTLKFAVGIMLSAFGVFWTGEGLGVPWPGADLAIVGFAAMFLAVSGAAIALARRPKVEVLP